EDLFLSDWVCEQAWRQLQIIKERCVDITVAVGLPFQLDGSTYNAVAVLSDQTVLGLTAKQNLARDGVHYEHRWFDEWPSGRIVNHVMHGETFPVGDIIFVRDGIRFGFEICEDAWRKDK